jgi:hypothetical protein
VVHKYPQDIDVEEINSRLEKKDKRRMGEMGERGERVAVAVVLVLVLVVVVVSLVDNDGGFRVDGCMSVMSVTRRTIPPPQTVPKVHLWSPGTIRAYLSVLQGSINLYSVHLHCLPIQVKVTILQYTKDKQQCLSSSSSTLLLYSSLPGTERRDLVCFHLFFSLQHATISLKSQRFVLGILQLLNDKLATIDLAKIICMQRLTTDTEYFNDTESQTQCWLSRSFLFSNTIWPTLSIWSFCDVEQTASSTIMRSKRGGTRGKGRGGGGGRGAHSNQSGRHGPSIQADFIPFSGTTLPRSPSHGKSTGTRVLYLGRASRI